LRVRRSVLGENDYMCYPEAGECVLEYKLDGLVTYKQEALCSRSEEGCGEGFMVLERAKREEMCVNMEEDMELCKRDVDPYCAGLVMKKMEEEGCSGLLEERRLRKKRDECVSLQKRFTVYCGGKRKRSISEECSAVMRLMDGSECGWSTELIVKRAAKCNPGWALRRGICYKYFEGPMNFHKAAKACSGADSDAQLATIESMLVKTEADRKFFNDLIASSGKIDEIDSVLGGQDDMFGGKDWKEVITYYDNWAWVGVKNSGDDDKKDWKWAVNNKDEADWNPVKQGHGDWAKKQPSHENDFGMDNGNCVVYFYNKVPVDSSLNGVVSEVGDVKAWWNVNCKAELPFLCEVRAD